MKIINIYDAKTQLSRLLREVAAGEDIVIAKDGTPLARLIPFEQEGEVRELGIARDRIQVSDDFDAPLPPDVQRGFDADSS
jgi:prevent-host-death family protein